MPTYEYECRACGYAFEELQAMTEKKLTRCPKCRKEKLSRLIGSGSGMIFKGTGFYVTDYKKKSSPTPSEKGAKPAPTAAPAASGPCGGSCACHGKAI